LLHPLPRPAPPDLFRLVKADDGFRERVVVRIAGAADRGLDAGLGEPLGIANRQVLHPAITVMDEWLRADTRAIVECLFQRNGGETPPAAGAHPASPRSAGRRRRSRKRRPRSPATSPRMSDPPPTVDWGASPRSAA